MLFAITYEERGFESLKRSFNKFNIKNVIIFQFNVKDYLSREVLNEWECERNKVLSFLVSKGIVPITLEANDGDFKDIFRRMIDQVPPDNQIIVDITTFPKNYILRLCKELDRYDVIFQYTIGERHVEPTDYEVKVGISKVISIDGFEGSYQVNGKTILIIILGFEASRALPLLEEIQAERILALIGVPGNDYNNEYKAKAQRLNKQLLNNSFVIQKEVHSLDPYIFSHQLSKIIEHDVNEYKLDNIVIVPIGTKAQTFGLYLYWKGHPNTQILYPLPNRRPKIALKTGETLYYRINKDVTK